MLRRILITALISGFITGIGISILQEFTTTPIILHAEEFEGNGSADANKQSQAHAPSQIILVGGAGQHDTEAEAWAPADGMERTFYTTLANVLAGTGFALILVACLALGGQPVNGRIGILWGLAGFAIFILAPALGLPPEVPGAMAAELSGRQAWWILCVVATMSGLWLLVFRPGIAWIVAGIVLIAAPHIFGAPQPERIGGTVPPELAGHIAAASIVTAAVFWCVLGWMSGTVWQRFERG